MNLEKILVCTALCLMAYGKAHTQKLITSSTDTVLSAGPEYKTSSFQQWLWGKNNRQDWAVPIKVPVVYLDKVLGGLTPVEAGGGNQTKSLKVKSKDGKLYTLRTVNKTLGKVLPKEFLGTFIEDLVDDKVSMSHPYGAAVVPELAESANVFHTNPQYVYLPKQSALDSFNNDFGGKMYLFEEKIDSDWRGVKHLGGFEEYKSTKTLLEKMLEDNDNRPDQKTYVRSRLMDMFINDWDRHEDQWEWGEGEKDDEGVKIFTPVPQDRDQAFFTFNGVFLKALIGASGLGYFQPFKDDIKDVKIYNYEERNLDRLFANELTLADWQNAAKTLQAALTDNVIETAVKKLPPESYALSGENIIKTLKARRQNILNWATEYYHFIAKEVDIPGSEKHEHFDVQRLNGKETRLQIFKRSKEGEEKKKPFYTRTFTTDETKEIRIYGLSGKDLFTVEGGDKDGVKIRVIGGNEEDSIIVNTDDVVVYDNKQNYFKTQRGTNLNLSGDSAIHEYEYKSFLYSKKGLSPTIFYSNEDRLFVGLSYKILTNKWRKEPFASKQLLQANYSVSQKAFSAIYRGLFPETIGKSDLDLFAMYDQVRWTNFFGLGNETDFVVDDIDFYRARTEQWDASAGTITRFGKNTVRFNGNFQWIRVLQDLNRFLGKTVVDPNDVLYQPKNFAGANVAYSVHQLNDSLVPTKGAQFLANVSFMQNLQEGSRNVANFSTDVQWYIPIAPKLSLALRAGAETVTGSPEFYQYASLGGSQQMRAFRAGRYWGKTAVYNSNALRYISDVKSYLYNGKAGLELFYDNGRVWMPGDNSNVWHDGYGFGIFLAPFNKIAADITYGFSRDDRLIQLRITQRL